MHTHTKGGTNAGIKRAKTYIPKDDWTCTKGHSCRFYWRNCPSCFEGRPKPNAYV